MFDVHSWLMIAHDPHLVGLAVLVCFLASLTAVILFHRARASRRRARVVWLALGGTAAGCGIWATHFVTMLAHRPGATVGYDTA